ncbi:hypothetical protein GPALN_013309 [Globodera pallida]|nr:hypothetical protein GPALN_013309 [Globodera pallida]
MDFADWSISVKTPIIYLTMCMTIPSMALYIAEIVTIVRHKKFHNSFYALFVLRAIPDLLYVLNSFYGQRLPTIIGAVLYPIYINFPNWMLIMFYFIGGHTFQANYLVTAFILLNRLTAIIMPIKHEKAPYCSYMAYINAVFSVIFTILCVFINIGTFMAYKQHLTKVGVNANNEYFIEKKLLFYALATFLGHMLVASLLLITIITSIINSSDTKTIAMMYNIYSPLIMDTGTVVLPSWLLLWASGTFRQQLIKDFTFIRKTTNIQTIRVGTIEGPRNNNLQAVGGTVGHQLQNRFFSSVQQLPTIS